MTQLIMTAVGPDRPGLVGELSGHLHALGANILDSRMVNLRGQFALVMLFECEPDKATELTQALPGVAERMRLTLHLTPRQPAAVPRSPGIPFRLKTYSSDQPGIVAKVSALLQGHGINIEDLRTQQESAPFDGSALFTMEMRLTIPREVPVRKLRGELENLCDALNCDVDLEPA